MGVNLQRRHLADNRRIAWCRLSAEYHITVAELLFVTNREGITARCDVSYIEFVKNKVSLKRRSLSSKGHRILARSLDAATAGSTQNNNH